MKRIVIIMLSLLLLFTLTACRDFIADSDISAAENQTDTPIETPAATPAETPAVTPTETPTETQDINGGPGMQAEVPAESSEESGVQAEDSGDEVIDITEKLYVTYINEIYLNTEDYLGKTIRIEGIYTSEYYEPTDTTYCYVYRVGPGCCGSDGSMCGFEFTWDGVDTLADKAWIEVVGVLDSYEELGNIFFTLRAQTVTVKEERGAETVYQ